jgi:16S rRNA (guanine527-N7)-methyltransferase
MIRPDLEKALLEMNFSLSDESFQLFELFAIELKKWNSKINLTAICNDSDIAIKHVFDSLVFAMYIKNNENVLDIGSGAGVPAIPLKIYKPEVRVVSVDSVGKKIMFQKHVARLLGLKGFEALHSRVESLHSSHAGLFDVISSRAFSRLDMFVSMAAPLLKCGGKIIAMKGPEVQSEIDSAKSSLFALGFEISSIINYTLPMDKGNRCLVTISAVKAHECLLHNS